MLAQLFFSPSGMMLDVTLVVAGASVAAGPQPSVAASVAAVGPQPSIAGCSGSVETGPHASIASTVGSRFSLREPLVCAVAAPRPRPPLPRSAPRLRPLPLSVPARPPRETLPSLADSPNVVTVASLAVDRDLSFFVFETSPHCVMDPVAVDQHATTIANGAPHLLCIMISTYHQLYGQLWSLDHRSSPAGLIPRPHRSSQGTSL